MLTLWYSPGTVALAVHIALEEVGVPYTLRRLSFPDGEQTGPDYLAINPKGRVPALKTPNGVLTETVAILAWIAEQHPETALVPADPFQRARGLALQTYLASTVHVNHAHKLRGARWSDDQATWAAMKAKVAANMTENAAYLEAAFEGAPWVLGDHFTTTDAYLYTVCRWLEGDGVDVTAFPKIRAHRAAMEARPAVTRVLEHHTA